MNVVRMGRTLWWACLVCLALCSVLGLSVAQQEEEEGDQKPTKMTPTIALPSPTPTAPTDEGATNTSTVAQPLKPKEDSNVEHSAVPKSQDGGVSSPSPSNDVNVTSPAAVLNGEPSTSRNESAVEPEAKNLTHVPAVVIKEDVSTAASGSGAELLTTPVGLRNVGLEGAAGGDENTTTTTTTTTTTVKTTNNEATTQQPSSILPIGGVASTVPSSSGGGTRNKSEPLVPVNNGNTLDKNPSEDGKKQPVTEADTTGKDGEGNIAVIPLANVSTTISSSTATLLAGEAGGRNATEPQGSTKGTLSEGSTATEPAYRILTDPPLSTTTTHNETFVVGPAASTGMSPKLIAIIVGVSVGLVVLIIVIIVVIFSIKKRRFRRRKDFPVLENPRYIGPVSTHTGHNYRFSRDASLLIGGPNIANNNLNEKDDFNSLRKKRQAPPPPNPFGEPDDEFTLRQDSMEYPGKRLNSKKKKRAPPPPNPFTGEIDAFSNPNSFQLYEKLSRHKKRRAPSPPKPPPGKATCNPQTNPFEPDYQDSPHGSEVELTTFGSPARQPVASNSTKPANGAAQGSHSDDEDTPRAGNEPEESVALLNDIERETGFRLTGGDQPRGRASASVADKYRFSDDEEAREARDYDREDSFDRFSSEDELEGSSRRVPYGENDIQEELRSRENVPDDDENFPEPPSPIAPLEDTKTSTNPIQS